MKLEGSCHCQAVIFSLQSPHPYPFNLCYCGICRKTNGSGGYAINLSGLYKTLEVKGEENISVYQAMVDGKKSNAKRHFCKICSSNLWLYDSRWPDIVHPHASSIDTNLPVPPEKTHLMLAYKAIWVSPNIQKNDQQFKFYPSESIEKWHWRLNLESNDE